MNGINTGSDTFRKVLVALIGIPLVLLMILSLEPIWLYGFFLIISILAVSELVTMFRSDTISGQKASPLLLYPAAVFYGLVFLLAMIAIRELPQGSDWLLLTIGATFFSDIGAFLAGRYWPGKRHTLPAWLNERKSYEGIIGGIILAVFAAILLLQARALPLSLDGLILLGACIGLTAQMGDLLESRLKRIAGVKDSGRILSGQGGILDTIDGLVLSGPTAWLLIQALAR